MDESVVAFYTAKRMQAKYGFDAFWIHYPKGFHWAPNINHESYRFNGMYGTLGRGEATPTVAPLPEFGHVVTLFSMTYDRGAKIVGVIEQRLGADAFYDFMKIVYAKYQFRILRVADFQRELEEYTGYSWEQFFKTWLYSKGMSDWAVEDVRLWPTDGAGQVCTAAPPPGQPTLYRAVVTVQQKAEFTEPTVLGVKFKKDGPYDLRIPICPGAAVVESDDPPARTETQPDGSIRIELLLPAKPTQISIDPEQVLPDAQPDNNHWHHEMRVKLTPLYTNLDDTDLTTAYDRWNVTIGPWFGTNAPQFGQRGYSGFRIGAYRIQEFMGGIYTAYDIDDQDVRLGADALIDHWPYPQAQVGVQFDHSLTPDWAGRRYDRGRAFARHVFHYTPSLYLDQMEYLDVYARLDNEFWRDHITTKPGIERYEDVFGVGLLYNRFYYVHYWDPAGGYWLWARAEYGWPVLGGDQSYRLVEGQFSFVKGLPDGLGYLSHTRIAARIYGAFSLPNNGEMFHLGGPTHLRGLDHARRQGNAVWIASLEWRFPLWTEANYSCCDNVARLRNLYGALFYDVGDCWIENESIGGVAHAVGGGLRFDTAFFSFVERATLRIDVATILNDEDAPAVQVWFGISQPF
jgi:hypothetical protein